MQIMCNTPSAYHVQHVLRATNKQQEDSQRTQTLTHVQPQTAGRHTAHTNTCTCTTSNKQQEDSQRTQTLAHVQTNSRKTQHTQTLTHVQPQTNSRKTHSTHKHLHMYNHKQTAGRLTAHTNTCTCTTSNKQQEDSQHTQTLTHIQTQTNSRKTHSTHKHLHMYKHKQTAGRLTVTVKLIYLTKHTGVTTTCVELCYINKLVADKLIYLTKLLN